LSVGVTERITRTAQEFVASQSGRLGVDNPADDALFKALLSIANADAIDATTVNPDLNRMLGALMETLVGGPALDAADLAEHMREFQMLFPPPVGISASAFSPEIRALIMSC
jgi:hypothetical protein